MKPQPVALLQDNYAWLLPIDADQAIVVDPSDADGVLAALKRAERRLVGIVVTHHHHDHVGGIEALVAASSHPLPVAAGAHDVAMGRIPHAHVAAQPGTTLTLGDCRLDVVATPGHTLGSVSYLWRDAGAIFSGDTLFHAGCGRTIEGDAATMHASLQKFAALDDETLVCCGHEYTEKNLQFAASILPEDAAVRARLAEVVALRRRGQPSSPSSIGLEKRVNLFLRVGEPELQRRLGTQEPVTTFAALRRLKDRF